MRAERTSWTTVHNPGSFHEYMGRTRYERLKRFIERARRRPSMPCNPCHWQCHGPASGPLLGYQAFLAWPAVARRRPCALTHPWHHLLQTLAVDAECSRFCISTALEGNGLNHLTK